MIPARPDDKAFAATPSDLTAIDLTRSRWPQIAYLPVLASLATSPDAVATQAHTICWVDILGMDPGWTGARIRTSAGTFTLGWHARIVLSRRI